MTGHLVELISVAAAPGAAGSERDAVRAVLADPRYQARLTHGAGDGSLQIPDGWLRLPFPDLPAVPAWAPVLALAVLVLVAMIPLLRRLTGSEGTAAVPSGGAIAAGETRHTLARARELGEAGFHLEAVHVLLLVAVDHWTASSPDPVRADQTSRELLRKLPSSMPAERREAMGQLVRAVEWSWFGGRPAGRAEYEQALRSCCAFLGEPA